MNDQTANVLTPTGGGRRRYLTLVFSDLCSSTALSTSMEAEWYAAMLTDLRHAYQEVLARHGGTVVRVQGDGVLAIFGHPETREDDARRATQAVLELHAVVRAMAPETGTGARVALALHSGIHSGLVLIDDGDVVRGRFELLGVVPNIAARLSEAAGRDEILVSEETLGPEFRYFDTSARLYVTLKGRAEPMSAYRILGQAGVSGRQQARRRRSLLPFIGRAEVLALLAPAAAGAGAGGAPRTPWRCWGRPGWARRGWSRSSSRGCHSRPAGWCAATARARSAPSPFSPFCKRCAACSSWCMASLRTRRRPRSSSA